MERRNYATIFLFIFVIIEAHSYPQRSDVQRFKSIQNFNDDELADYEADIKKNYVNEVHDDLYLQKNPLNKNGDRVRRDVKTSHTQRLNKMLKDLDIARHGQEARRADAQRARDDEALLQQFRTIIENYQLQRQSILVALNRFERDHPDLVTRLLELQDRQQRGL